MNYLNDSKLQHKFEALLEEKDQLFSSLNRESDGYAWCTEHTRLVDRGIIAIFQSLVNQMPRMPTLAIIATGGYGRCELAPYSDIDLTVVPKDDDDPDLDMAVRVIYRALHTFLGSQLGYDIGYAYRQITDLPGLDQVTRTGLIDSRFITGSNSVFTSLMDGFWTVLPAGEFALEKITERNLEMSKSHVQPLVVEPNVKLGAGGLRSFQCSNWIRAAIGERELRTTLGYAHLIKIRNLLHSVAGRKQDLLTHGLASSICTKFELSEDELLDQTLQGMLEGQQIYFETLERLKEARFQLSDAVFTLNREARTVSYADGGEAAAGIAVATQLGLKVSTFGNSYSNTINGPSVMYALTQGESVIRNLDRAGALQVLLPELTSCRTLLPGDPSHIYSVFEHTLQVVNRLDHASDISYYGELRNSVNDLGPLYLAALIHDVGKKTELETGEDHCVEGAEIARKVGERFGLSQRDTQTVAWLVREHLTMSLFIRIRDIGNPNTITEFAKIVGTADRLNMLVLLTWADISAVNPDAFTSAQDSLLRELTAKTTEVLEGNVPSIEAQHELRKRQLRKLNVASSHEELECFLETLPASYLASTSISAVSNHIEYVKLAKNGQAIIDTSHQPDLAATEVLVCTSDRQGLLSDILGIFYAFDLSIGGLKAFTTKDENAIAIDTFTIRFNGRPVPSTTLSFMVTALQELLDGEKSLLQILSSKGKDPERTQVISRYQFLAGTPAIIEIHGPRGRGMPYRLARLITDHGMNIQTARIGQWAGSAAASFYVLPINESDSIEELVHAAMKEALKIPK